MPEGVWWPRESTGAIFASFALATSDSRSRTTGAALLSGNRLPVTTAHGRRCLIGKDRSGPPRQEGP